MQYDPDKPEDLDTEQEDHCVDDWRYACNSRPYVLKPVVVEKTPELEFRVNPSGQVVANRSVYEIIMEKQKRRERDW
jgi:hypothetical protein